MESTLLAAVAVGIQYVHFLTRLLQHCILTLRVCVFVDVCLLGLLVQVIDCDKFDWLEFDIGPAKRQELLRVGMVAAAKFLMK